jgi:hypothetical protein
MQKGCVRKHVCINLDNEKDTIVREIEKQKRKTVMQMKRVTIRKKERQTERH